nr:hypothetical protein [uncultured Methanobacterium sp.]
MNKIDKKTSNYEKPRLVTHDSVKRLTKAWNVASEDGDMGEYS